MEKAKEIISEYMPVFIMGSTELIKDYDLYRRFVKSYETVPEVETNA